MKTVIEYLKENLLIGLTLSNEDIEYNYNIFKQAEIMEEQQILDAWKEGYDLAINGERIPKL
ncbi:hypothetical protein UFOVP622_45 [uncultured Caudovirales phage]|uniref:Uncharacterized protein n=1 Tax=uncultured Caudovirales phage TaxID=2100421 RepID=A0A6J5N3X8_9CAUD|nr:hypothetical protein UFOVP622_45 [uncultured Caudovirales phage]